MIELGAMLFGIILSLISIRMMKNIKSVTHAEAKDYFHGKNRTRKHEILLYSPLVIMLGCIIVHFALFTYMSMYICLAIYAVAFIICQLECRKHFFYLDLDNERLILPNEVIPLGSLQITDRWICTQSDFFHMECCLQAGDRIFAIVVRTRSEWDRIEEYFLQGRDLDYMPERMEKKRKLGIIISVVAVLMLFTGFFAGSMGSGGIAGNDRDYEKAYEEQIGPTLSYPDAITILEDGKVCSLYCSEGVLSIYDPEGKHICSFLIPLGDDEGHGGFELETDGSHIAVINAIEEAYIYYDEAFVEKLSRKEAEKKYELTYIDEEEENEELGRFIRPDVKEPKDSGFGMILILLAIPMFLIGRCWLSRSDFEHLEEEINSLRD